MIHFLRHFFLPHHSNNQRAKLIHSQTIFIVAALLVATSFLFSSTRQYLSGVLGASVDISSQELLLLTNQKRADAGLQPVQLDQQLSQAAAGKAQDMFGRHYWAHFAPDGTSPWDFIKGAGYSYVYAGENLARGYTTASDVVNAWMASPDHRANMLSAHYADVGFAVARGGLPGDNDTILVVEMFGSKVLATPEQKTPPVVTISPEAQKVIPTAVPNQVAAQPTLQLQPVLAAVKKQPLFDSSFLTKTVSLVLLGLFLIVFALDLILTESRKAVRLAGHSFDHLLFLIGILIIAISVGMGIVG